MERDNRLLHHFGSGLSATLACSSLTAFISDLHYINHTIRAGLPSRLVAGSLSPLPRGFGLSPFGRGYHFASASAQSLPTALGTLGYCQWNSRFGHCRTIQLSDFVSHPEVGIKGSFGDIAAHMDFFVLVALAFNTAFSLGKVTGSPR